MGAPFTVPYLPDRIIEGYTSLIWTERFQQPGEFELRTPMINEMAELLPEMTFVTHKETLDVMMVETHDVTHKDDGSEELLIKGRSLDAFLEHRHLDGPYGKKRKSAKEYSPRGVLGLLLWNAFDNTTGQDVTKATGTMGIKDALPNVMISETNVAGGDNRRWWFEQGPLYPQILKVMERYDIGLRVIRPPHTNALRVSVSHSGSTRGDITRTVVPSSNAIRFDLFQGIDRSHTQSVNDPVKFETLHGHIVDPNYLFSVQTYKTACEVMSGAGGSDQYRNSTEQAYTGWQRRVMSVDAGEPEIPDNATNSEVNTIKNEFREDAERDALRSLRRSRRIKTLSGAISTQTPYKFKTHYNLGDTVSLFGEYGLAERMVVTEYVRTEDSEGDRGYPGLTLP